LTFTAVYFKMKKMKSNIPPPTPHMGNLLKTYFRAKHIRKAVLARLLQRDKSSISRYQKRKTLAIDILWDISHALQHNFFSDIAAQLPAHFSSDIPADTSKDELINTLQEENKQLTTQVATLKEVLQTKT
jgi:hypothetical protein